MNSARILHHPKPIHPNTYHKPIITHRSFIKNTNFQKGNIKLDKEDKEINERAAVEREITQKWFPIRIQRANLQSANSVMKLGNAPRRPKNPMTKDKAFYETELREIDTDSSIDSDYECNVQHK